MSEKRKIFDDFPKVECNDCERWWVDQCDGAAKGQNKPCTSFLATRSVSIPQEIESLRVALKRQEKALIKTTISTILLGGAYILHLLSLIFG